MEFKKFVELTRPIIGGKGGVHIFVRTLFDTILNDDGKDILDDYSDSSYKAYANGTTQITEIAKAMSLHLEEEEFASYIDSFGDSIQLRLCEEFEPFLLDINAFNVGKKLADLFARIIREAAGTKRRSSASRKKDAGHIEAEVVDDEKPSGAAQDDTKVTVIQQQINVVQNGENNYSLTNNGTINFNF